jgi:septal ring factor EnvC (AmiA/AmiB activator)
MLVTCFVFAADGCGALYSSGPRYRRSNPQSKSLSGATGTRPASRSSDDKRRGVLPWPVQGQVVSRFGTVIDPRYGTVTRNSGIDIATRNGSPVLAVDSGTVSFADIFMGYGRMVILDHGKRVHSIYSKLSDVKVKVGTRVARGSTIALSGDTLHFEFRVGGKSVDPLDWLVPR